MRYYEVAPTHIIRQDSRVFTYSHADELPIGLIVMVEVGKKQLTAVIIKEVPKPSYITKDILSVIEDNPLPPPLVKLAVWLSDYYATHLATVLQTLLPRGVNKERRHTPKNIPPSVVRKRTHFLLNDDQLSAVDTIENAPPGTILLHGVTGSGKTAIYIEAVKKSLANNKSAIVLVPEIALTSQIVDDFTLHIPDIILTHSKQTEAERHNIWKTALSTDRPLVVIGPRSALFMPLSDVGLIVIDEFHEPSYKQEQSPRYSALRAASILAAAHSAKLVLGSATPTVADYFIAKSSNKPIITIQKTANESRPPKIDVIDMTKRSNFTRHRFFSDKLLDGIDAARHANDQILLFHNRRGSASMTLCENCGWNATCPRCFVPLTLHGDIHKLQCHICAHAEHVPTSCPICHHANILHKGIGTKVIESELQKLYPNISIARFDGDTGDETSLNNRYSELYNGEIRIIIGTQVVAKGLDLPHLRVVGVIQADAGLSLPDYISNERTFQLIAQVVGRVGRSDHETSVYIQSYQPQHPSIVYGTRQDYSSFYESTIIERSRAKFPPFAFLLVLTCVYKTESAAIKNARQLAITLQKKIPSEVQILGPTPSFHERQRDTYRWQLVLKSSRRSHLIDAMKFVPTTHWQFDLDPASLL